MTDYFPLQSLIEFTARQNPAKSFNVWDPDNCPLAQFARYARLPNFEYAVTSGFYANGKHYSFERADGRRLFPLADVLVTSFNWGELLSNLRLLNSGALQYEA